MDKQEIAYEKVGDQVKIVIPQEPRIDMVDLEVLKMREDRLLQEIEGYTQFIERRNVDLEEIRKYIEEVKKLINK